MGLGLHLRPLQPRQGRLPLTPRTRLVELETRKPDVLMYSSGQELRTPNVKNLRLASDDATYVMKLN